MEFNYSEHLLNKDIFLAVQYYQNIINLLKIEQIFKAL